MNKRLIADWRRVLKLAWPLIVANGFWNLQTTIDRIFLGHYSTDALGAAMAAVGLFWAPMALVQGTASYVTTFVAQYQGAANPKMIGVSLWQATYLSLIGGLLFLFLIPLAPLIFEIVGHSENLQTLEVIYFQTVSYSALPTALVAVASGFFTGIGRSSMVLWINGVGLVGNVVLDYLLIFGNFGFPAMGMAGAGYATAGANALAAAAGFLLIFNRRNEARFQVLSGWRVNLNLLRRLLKFGVPSGMQWALEGLAFTVFLVFIGRLPNGDIALSASSITVTIMMLAVLPPLGVAQAVSVLVGQNLGASRPRAAERSAWTGIQIAICYLLVLSASFLLFPEFFMNWFKNPQNTETWIQVTEIVPWLLMLVSIFILFDSSNLVFSFALKGAGDTRFVTLVALTLPWPLMILPTWLVSDRADGVYWAWVAASVFICIQAIVFWRRFANGKWKSMRVIEMEPAPLPVVPPT